MEGPAALVLTLTLTLIATVSRSPPRSYCPWLPLGPCPDPLTFTCVFGTLQEDLQSNQPDWAKGLPTLGQIGSSPRHGGTSGGDPRSFDDWQEGSERRWGQVYQDTVNTSFEKRKKKTLHGSAKKKPLDRYTESYEGISDGGRRFVDMDYMLTRIYNTRIGWSHLP